MQCEKRLKEFVNTGNYCYCFFKTENTKEKKEKRINNRQWL